MEETLKSLLTDMTGYRNAQEAAMASGFLESLEDESLGSQVDDIEVRKLTVKTKAGDVVWTFGCAEICRCWLNGFVAGLQSADLYRGK